MAETRKGLGVKPEGRSGVAGRAQPSAPRLLCRRAPYSLGMPIDHVDGYQAALMVNREAGVGVVLLRLGSAIIGLSRRKS